GPKAIELAGEIADGALLLVGFNRGIVEKALEHLERGARRSGRRLDDLEIVWAVRVGVAVTTAEARRLARPTAVHWGVLRWGGHWVEPAGLRLPKLEIPEAVWKIYPDLSHAHDWEAAGGRSAREPGGGEGAWRREQRSGGQDGDAQPPGGGGARPLLHVRRRVHQRRNEGGGGLRRGAAGVRRGQSEKHPSEPQSRF